jgi:hypothetical protein
MEAEGMTDAEKEVREKKKKAGFTREQRKELAVYEFLLSLCVVLCFS